jgi:hypothetical protein
MKVEATVNSKNTEKLFLLEMKNEGVVDIGCNPSLAEIINKTWGWPAVKVFYLLNNQPAAFLSAVRIEKKWVALPHFDHGSLWVSRQLVTDGKGARFPKGEKEIHQFLYNIFATATAEMVAVPKKCHSYTIDLTGMKATGDQPLQVNPAIQFVCRSHLPLFRYHIENKVIPVLQLAGNRQQQLQAFSSNVRRKINKSRSNGFVLQTGGIELLGDFYKVYRSNIRRLGSFGLPKLFFKNLLHLYQNGQAVAFVAYLGGKPAGASILLTFLNRAENGWFSSLKPLNRLYVTYFLHDAMMDYAIKAGCASYSFGRSTRNSPGHIYKQQWGTCDTPLYLNATRKMHDATSGHQFTRCIVRWMPKQVSSLLDNLVARIIW